jgi:hypothetical protein
MPAWSQGSRFGHSLRANRHTDSGSVAAFACWRDGCHGVGIAKCLSEAARTACPVDLSQRVPHPHAVSSADQQTRQRVSATGDHPRNVTPAHPRHGFAEGFACAAARPFDSDDAGAFEPWALVRRKAARPSRAEPPEMDPGHRLESTHRAVRRIRVDALKTRRRTRPTPAEDAACADASFEAR